MWLRAAQVSFLLVVAGSFHAGASTYTVTSATDSGAGTLRAAITEANLHAGADTIGFAAALEGVPIQPTSRLPTITDPVSIDGDLDDNGDPDIFIDGSLTTGCLGLDIEADGCVLEGLAIARFTGYAVRLGYAENCGVYSCHLNVNLSGKRAFPCSNSDLHVQGGGGHTIGARGRRNVFAGGRDTSTGLHGAGVSLGNTHDNVIAHNYFGVNRAGDAALGTAATGVAVDDSTGNRIHHNVVAGVYWGVLVSGSSGNRIYANTFGLTAAGTALLPIKLDGVHLRGGSTGNTIGGTSDTAHNVFAGDAMYGIGIEDPETADNAIQGNWFGVNAAGTAQQPVHTCIRGTHAGRHTIGGAAAGARNYLAPEEDGTGVFVSNDTARWTIRGNSFGVLPDGSGAAEAEELVRVHFSSVLVRDNTFSHAGAAVYAAGGDPTDRVDVFGNRFRNCYMAIDVGAPLNVRMGNLSNASTSDDGGNVFRSTNTWFIYNRVPEGYRAEGNDFGTTERAAINAKIHDGRDNPGLGRIDFDPLAGGVHPTSGASAAMVSAASAIPTVGGAEIAYTLSGPADVTVRVLNVAGRPVATVARDRAADVGLQRLVWSGRADTGLRVPAGPYLVEITARSAGGSQARALTTVRLAGK